MSSGKVVLTSREREVPSGFFDAFECECYPDVKKNILVWNFKYEDDAIRAARIFMESGFEYVKRVI